MDIRNSATVTVRCETCLGMGYKGRNRRNSKGFVWKIETCRACGGRGDRDARDIQRPRKAVGASL